MAHGRVGARHGLHDPLAHVRERAPHVLCQRLHDGHARVLPLIDPPPHACVFFARDVVCALEDEGSFLAHQVRCVFLLDELFFFGGGKQERA